MQGTRLIEQLRRNQVAIISLVVAIISCYKGFFVTGGAAGVGRAANDAVVICITTFLILNYFLTSLIWTTT